MRQRTVNNPYRGLRPQHSTLAYKTGTNNQKRSDTTIINVSFRMDLRAASKREHFSTSDSASIFSPLLVRFLSSRFSSPRFPFFLLASPRFLSSRLAYSRLASSLLAFPRLAYPLLASSSLLIYALNSPPGVPAIRGWPTKPIMLGYGFMLGLVYRV
ncbi:hypothetical protein ACLB2K_032396 [Fragaria x ananassa]